MQDELPEEKAPALHDPGRRAHQGQGERVERIGKGFSRRGGGLDGTVPEHRWPVRPIVRLRSQRCLDQPPAAVGRAMKGEAEEVIGSGCSRQTQNEIVLSRLLRFRQVGQRRPQPLQRSFEQLQVGNGPHQSSSSQVSETRSSRPQLAWRSLPASRKPDDSYKCRAALSSLCVHRTSLRYRHCSANRTHSSTRRLPIPRPRADGSTSSRRSLATCFDFATTKTEPRRSPSLSAIQQRSRAGSKWCTNPDTICATNASNRSSYLCSSE